MWAEEGVTSTRGRNARRWEEGAEEKASKLTSYPSILSRPSLPLLQLPPQLPPLLLPFNHGRNSINSRRKRVHC